MNALKPFYYRINMKLDSKCTSDVYEFIYKTALKNYKTVLILDKFDKDFIDEVSLFKDTSFNINIKSTEDIKDESYIYFCEDIYLKDIDYSEIGTYHDFSKPYEPITKTRYFNLDETFVRNDINNIITSLSNTTKYDNYQLLLLDELKLVNNIESSLDRYLLENRNTLFLDSEGNFYNNFTFNTKLGNIVDDSIELVLARYAERKYKND